MREALLAVLVAGCSDGGMFADNTPDDPCAAAPGIRAELEIGVAFWTPDHEDALAAHLIAGGFGGLYLEQSDTVALVLVDPSKEERATQQFRAALACNAIYANSILKTIPSFSIVVRDGDFDAIRLLDWRTRAAEVAFEDPDVRGLGINRMRNRIVITVSNAGAIQRVENLVASAGVPRAALIVEQ